LVERVGNLPDAHIHTLPGVAAGVESVVLAGKEGHYLEIVFEHIQTILPRHAVGGTQMDKYFTPDISDIADIMAAREQKS
jgi:hypothetical protein